MTSKDIDAIVDGLAAKGLAVVPANLVDPAIQLKKAQDRLMKRSKLTPYEIAKFNLIGVNSQNTIKNMVKDGRIAEHEHYRDRNNNLYITTACVRRLNDKL